tara:strand:- start:781 stop:1119 length:339 start_codon:yes stop_codon:yes gene_type:complete
MAEEDMNMDSMGERPPMMPAMEGANMQRNPAAQMPQEAVTRLMQPSEEIGAVLLARLSNMSPEELRMLDTAITPDVAGVLMKLLPELQQIISQVGGQQRAPREPQMGALSGM